MESLKKLYSELLEATTLKRFKYGRKIQDEYERLEQVPPAPGNVQGQHDAMVSLGLCEVSRSHEAKNR